MRIRTGLSIVNTMLTRANALIQRMALIAITASPSSGDDVREIVDEWGDLVGDYIEIQEAPFSQREEVNE
jgi:hypothetical protein